MMTAKAKRISKTEDVSVSDNVLPVYSDIQTADVQTGLNVRRFIHNIDMDILLESIRSQGILEPLLVSHNDGGYHLIAGERRLRCAKSLSMETVPCLVYEDISDKQLYEIMLSENLFRVDLNPLEEAEGFRKLVDAGMSQKDLAARIGMTQPYVANRLRLLSAPDVIQEMILSQEITPSHANVLLPFSEMPVFPKYIDFLKKYQKEERKEDPGYSVSVKSLVDGEIWYEFVYGGDPEIKSCDYAIGKFINSDCPDCADCQTCSSRINKSSIYCMNSDCVAEHHKKWDAWRKQKETVSDNQPVPVKFTAENEFWKFRGSPLSPSDCAGCENLVTIGCDTKCLDPECKEKKDAEKAAVLLAEDDRLRSAISEYIVSFGSDWSDEKMSHVSKIIVDYFFEAHGRVSKEILKEIYGEEVKSLSFEQRSIVLLTIILRSKYRPESGHFLTSSDFEPLVEFAADNGLPLPEL